jgi:hypothetical protein
MSDKTDLSEDKAAVSTWILLVAKATPKSCNNMELYENMFA